MTWTKNNFSKEFLIYSFFNVLSICNVQCTVKRTNMIVVNIVKNLNTIIKIHSGIMYS